MVLKIDGLIIEYRTLRGPLKAVDGVSLAIGRGEWVSVVGESGSGKTTLALSIPRLLPANATIVGGTIEIEGVAVTRLGENELRRRVRGRLVGVVFQEPGATLDPLRRVGDQIAEALMVHGLASTKEEALRLAGDALEKVGVPRERVSSYPFQLSGGQRQRVAIAAAIALEPKLLVADEPTTALDVVVQSRIMDLLDRLRDEMDLSILLVTHDIALAAERSDRIAVMYAGKLAEEGPAGEIVSGPLHPYTRGLLDATPDLWGERRKPRPIPGSPPDLRNPPSGCRFHPRCPLATSECKEREPPEVRGSNGRRAYCFHPLTR